MSGQLKRSASVLPPNLPTTPSNNQGFFNFRAEKNRGRQGTLRRHECLKERLLDLLDILKIYHINFHLRRAPDLNKTSHFVMS